MEHHSNTYKCSVEGLNSPISRPTVEASVSKTQTDPPHRVAQSSSSSFLTPLAQAPAREWTEGGPAWVANNATSDPREISALLEGRLFLWLAPEVRPAKGKVMESRSTTPTTPPRISTTSVTVHTAQDSLQKCPNTETRDLATPSTPSAIDWGLWSLDERVSPQASIAEAPSPWPPSVHSDGYHGDPQAPVKAPRGSEAHRCNGGSGHRLAIETVEIKDAYSAFSPRHVFGPQAADGSVCRYHPRRRDRPRITSPALEW